MNTASPNHKHIRTLMLHVKDKHSAVLARQARAVNFVWNYISELSERSIRDRDNFLSAFEIYRYITDSSKEVGSHSHIVQKISAAYVQARIQFKKRKLA